MKTLPAWILVLGCALTLAACGDDASSQASHERLPHVLAPTDTTSTDGAAVAAAAPVADTSAARWQAAAPYRNWPRADRLTYARYRNDAFGFSIAYPDTVLKPRADVGGAHGREFSSADGKAVVLVYAVEEASRQALADQYQDYLDDPGLRLTYHVREDDWYVVAGFRDDRKFYEKTFYRNGRLKTFQIQYDTTHAAYYDVVTVAMATSFKG